MATKKITGLLLVVLFSLALIYKPAVGNVWFAKQDRKLALALAARQIKLYEAKIDSDWEAIYSMLTPQIRSQLDIETFVTHPQFHGGEILVMDNERNQNDKGISKKEKFGGKKFHPPILHYRILSFKFSGDRKSARVEAEITQPYPPAISPTMFEFTEKEHWSYINGTWYVEWDLKYIARVSGATTAKKKYLPRYIFTIRAQELSLWYMERSMEFEVGDVKSDLIERALLLDPYNSAEQISKTGASADVDEMSKRYIDRALKGRKTAISFFVSAMEMGYWYGLTGDLDKSYESYRKAHLMDRLRQDPLEGMVTIAYEKGDYAKAAGHYVDLIRLMSVTGFSKTKTLEPYLVGDCEFCSKVDKSVLVSLARELVFMKKNHEALGVYSFLLKNSDRWQEVSARIRKGKKIKLSAALDEELLRELSLFTYDELSGLSVAAGFALFHPADIPSEVYPKGKGVGLESLPMLTRISYEGLQNIRFNKPQAKVSGEKRISEINNNSKGYIALFSKGGIIDCKFYPDSNRMRSGSKALAIKIGEAEVGTYIYITRLSTGKHTPENFWTNALQEAGADLSRIGSAPSSHILVFRKGGGYSRSWEGFQRISKQFKPSNLESFKSAEQPALLLSGVEPGDYILYNGVK